MNKEKQKKTYTLPTVLIILDGFGLANGTSDGNAITPKTAPHIFRYMDQYPTSVLDAHGKAVGLFAGQEGNSEAGHFNIGAGRIVKQDIVRISESIEDGTFFKNEAFQDAIRHCKKHKSAMHLVGLLTNGNSAHAHPDHIYALLEYIRKKKQKQVYIHLFTDGRDSRPHLALEFMRELKKYMKGDEKIASVSGRIFGMDRNKNWERTKAAYDAIVLGKGSYTALSAEEAVVRAYDRKESDEYIQPTVMVHKNGEPRGVVQDGDAVIMFNARSDRARQLTKAFVQPDFQKKNTGAFRRTRIPKNVCFVAMTDFGPDLPGIRTAFPSPDIEVSLPCVIGTSHKQLYISESEKYAHITYFLNGGYAEARCAEHRYLVRSSSLWNFAKSPGMKSKQVTSILLEKIKKDGYTFVAVNFPNADMLGHTGNIIATKKAITYVDEQVARIVSAVLRLGGQVVITADHGNAEMMVHKKNGEILTEHTTNPVPCIMIKRSLQGKTARYKRGKLADVTPTLLHMMEIKKPKEMTGRSLLG